MNHKTYDTVYIGMFAVLLTICSWISLPTLIPFTLQTFGIFLTLFILGGKRGTIVTAVYLLLGMVGIPVFSHFNAGLGYLLGNTGGFALGFLWIGLICWFFESFLIQKPALSILSMILGLICCYAFGMFWFMNISLSSNHDFSLTTVFCICVLPFIIPDLCKLLAAYLISKRIKPLLNIK